jgi:hypothetical protein
MKLCGWKTRAMFDRYNIIDEQDLAQAVRQWPSYGQVRAFHAVTRVAKFFSANLGGVAQLARAAES